MSDVAVQAPEAPKSDNSISRIFGVLFSPKATFESIARRPTWLAPVVLLCLVFFGVVGIFGHRGGWPSYFQKQLTSNARFQQASPEQQQQAYEMQLKYGPPVAYAEAPIVPPLIVVIVAAVFLGVFNLLAGAKLGFKTSMAVVSYAWMPNAVSGIFGILIVAIKDPTTIDLQNIVASNVGAYLPSGSAKWLVSLLGSIDIFSIWTMILMAIGFSVAAGQKKLTFGKAFGWIIAVWLLFVLVKVGLVAALT
ncbi:MAG TPA: YIP1 family protein [Candidatus Acidoferrales bacterium]|nr:YIP1 family protein [Candidatus Acidoferrales bacterium]